MWHSFKDTISLFNSWQSGSPVSTLLWQIVPWRIWSIAENLAICHFFQVKTAILEKQIFFKILPYHINSLSANKQDWKMKQDWKTKLPQFYEFQRDSPRYEPWTYLWYMTKPVINLWGDNSEIPHIFVSSQEENKTWSAHLVIICKPSVSHHTSSDMLQYTINLISSLHYLD